MSMIRDVAFDWLFNASVQIGLFVILAAALSPFIAKARAKVQHCFYLAIFVLCLAAPVFNTLWQTRPSMLATISQQQPTVGSEHAGRLFWGWSGLSKAHESITMPPSGKSALLLIWKTLFLFQAIQFGRRIYRVHRLRTDAAAISLSGMGTASSMIEGPSRIALLESKTIDEPVTVGVFYPAIVLPSKLIPALDEADLAVILAHEYSHIRRKDFLVQLLCQLTALPVAWHPGMRYLMSKISQTRELACDDAAAVRVGMRLAYAGKLLRLASLCVQIPRSNATGLGIFDGDNLEDRLMMLTRKRTSLSSAGLTGLALAACLVFGSGTVLARTVSLQEAPSSTNTALMFAGTWHFMFHGHSFATMLLVQNGSGFTGSVTGSKIALDDNGELSRADPSDQATPSTILKTKLEGNALQVTVADGDQEPFEFTMTMKDTTHAEIHPDGAPLNMKPIQLERAH